ncbi:MAG: hypothetical protein CSA81_11310 [Acidobacteria bacterium]|nr:MAG: hypothetical protein CSA81_11310 [Acidobacteriota bacterium]PIE89963.1 MAG: hypothetical protein CR997_08270 [Acidobacteriota bacterium]
MRKKCKLLIADSDEQHLNTTSRFFTQNGFAVIKAQKGKQSFQYALKADPDICLIDSQLEDINGFTVCRSIKKRRPDLPILVCSSVYKGQQNRKKAKEKFLANNLIEKPISHTELLKLVLAEVPAETNIKKSHSIEEKLEQTLSGLDLSGKTKKKKPEFSLTSTIQVNTEELKRELNKLKTEKRRKQSSKDQALFKVGAVESSRKDRNKLSSKDIFGDLISDIEKGVGRKKTATPAGPFKQTDLSAASVKVTKPSAPKEKPLQDKAQSDAQPDFKASTAQMSEAMNSKANDYELIEKIATGGMAEVWKARLKGEKGFEKIVAIKKILPHLSDNDEFVTMFIDEAKVAANLTHPNIAQIYELGKFGDTFFIAMEYVAGKNLRAILNYCKSVNVVIPPSIVMFIGVKLCDALEYAHKKKDHSRNQPLHLVHRDISPQNILISNQGEIKLVDFGIAKASIKAANTVAGSLKGKLLYMSPEQAEGKPIDHRSDIFSLGNLLYESLTAKRLVDGDSELSILKKVREADFTQLRAINPAVPVKLEKIILKALQKDPNQRYSTARELELELKNYMKSEKIHVTESDVVDFMTYIDAKDNQKISEFEAKRSHAEKAPDKDKAPVILPDKDDVEKHKEESLQGLSSKRAIPWVWVAILIPILAVILYFGYKFLGPQAEEQEPKISQKPPIEQPDPGMEKPVQAVEGDLPAVESLPTEESPVPTEETPSGPETMPEKMNEKTANEPVPSQEPVQPAVAESTDASQPENQNAETEKKADGTSITANTEVKSPDQPESIDELKARLKELQQKKIAKKKKLEEFKKANQLEDDQPPVDQPEKKEKGE